MNRKHQQRLASTQRLLDSALHLFVSRGYRSTNLEQIAGDAKLSKGTVFFYFGSKEAVLLELLKRVQAIVVDEAIRIATAAGPGQADRLVAFLHHQASLGVTHRDEVLLLILMSLEFGEVEGEVQKLTRGIYRRLYAFVERVIRAGQKAGELRTDLQPRELASIIMANHDGTFLEWYRRSGSLRGPALVRALREVVLSGVRQPPRKSGAKKVKKA
jgi:AcrR family transcriptional regulator